MSARRNALYAGLLVAGVAVALPGCAVMRIDVDVYKGPLAEEEDVQVHNLASTATAAKPLLTQLRDKLQWPDDRRRICALGNSWYESRFFSKPRPFECDDKDIPFAPRNEQAARRFAPWNEQAARVNAVLSLYEDRTNVGLGIFIKKGKAAFLRLQRAQAVLNPRAAEDEKSWQIIEQGFVNQLESADAEFEAIKKKYKSLLNPKGTRRVVKGLWACSNAYWKKLSKPNARRTGNLGQWRR